MGREQELFERAISEAYARQTEIESTSTSDTRRRIVSRGRRRRALRGLGSVVVLAVIATGAVAAIAAVGDDHRRLQPIDEGPAIGAKKVVESGGPLAASNDALFVANGYLTNDAGDRSSIARLDLATDKVTNTDPSTLATPQNVAMRKSGLWMVGWEGDLPLEDGESNRARGGIQLVDPASGEVHLDLPRENSAPQDVAAGEAGGREVAWVADMGRGELLEVDAASGAIETIDVGSSPNNVAVGAGAVWMSSNLRGADGGVLTRYEPESGTVESFPVDHCMNDLVVMETSVWALDYCGKAVHRFDAASGEELAAVSLGEAPLALTVADDLIWILEESGVVRVDPAREEVVGDPIGLGERIFIDAHITAADDTVYVSTFSGVYRLGEGLQVREAVPPPTPEPEEPREPLAEETCNLDNVMCIPLDREMSVAGAGFGSAWVGDFEIARFDAESGEEVARLDNDGYVRGFAPDGRWMWALLGASNKLTLLKIDPETTSVSASFDLGDPGNISTPSIAAGGGNVWVSLPRGSVTRVSASDGETTTTSYADDLPGYGVANGPLRLAFGDERLWLSYGQGHLGVVDPSSGELVRLDKDALAVSANDIVVAAGAVWSPHQTDGDNVISYSSTSGPDDGHGRVLLGEAIPELAATDGETIWVTQTSFDENEPGFLVAVDARTREVVGEPLEVDLEFPGGVAVGEGYTWVTGYEVLYRITP